MLTSLNIVNYRLKVQHLLRADFESPEEVVRYFGAVQAQDYAGAKWALGLRMKHATADEIERAVAERKILRTWPQRGTIHFVLPEEARWRLALGAPRILAGAKKRHSDLGLTQADFDRGRELFYQALKGDKQLTRLETMQVLEKGGIDTAGQRGYHLLWWVAQKGHICFGPLRGKQPTFALLDDWAPFVPEISHDEALKRLTTTYFVSHGPATVQDLRWWSGLTVADIKRGIELAADSLESTEVEGKTYWLATGTKLPAATSNALTHLLPNYDEYIVGYTDRSTIFDPRHTDKLDSRANPLFQHTIMLNGQLIGTWRRTLKAKGIQMELTLFRKLSKSEKESVEVAAQKYARFVEQPLVSIRTF